MVFDDARVSTDGLTDEEVRSLRDTYAGLACDEEVWLPVRRWYGRLARSLHHVLQARTLRWLDVLADPTVPPDWATAVAALPLEDTDTDLS